MRVPRNWPRSNAVAIRAYLLGACFGRYACDIRIRGKWYMHCLICASSSKPFGKVQVLRKYEVAYFRCGDCGFIQTESPHWLPEAYSDAIAKQDVGIMGRNQLNTLVTSSLLALSFPSVRQAVDFGGGHGVFVRMMRDRGYDFFWRDLYAANTFARGFEYDPDAHYDFLTAFEVLEHFTDPMADYRRPDGKCRQRACVDPCCPPGSRARAERLVVLRSLQRSACVALHKGGAADHRKTLQPPPSVQRDLPPVHKGTEQRISISDLNETKVRKGDRHAEPAAQPGAG